MAVIAVTCPNPACRAKLKAPAERIGKKAKCNKCHEEFRIPRPSSAADAGGGQAPGTLDTAVPMAFPVDDGDDKAERVPTIPPPVPTPKAPPTPPAKKLEDLPSADPFDFQKLGTVPANAAAGAPKVIPSPTTAPKPASPKPAPPTPASRQSAPPAPASKTRSEARPTAALGEPLPTDANERTKSKPKVKKTEPEPLPEPASDTPFAFAEEPKAKTAEPRDAAGVVDRPREKKREDKAGEEQSRSKRSDEKANEPEPPKKSKSKSASIAKAAEPPPANDNAFAFGFTNEPEPEGPKESNRRPGNAEEAEERPRYKRQKSGAGKALLLSGIATLVALALVTAAVVGYIRSNRTEEAKTEEKQEEPAPTPGSPAPVPPIANPPATPKDQPGPTKPAEPEPKPKEKEKAPTPGRPPFELAEKLKSFTVGPEPAKLERADAPAEPRFILETPFASVVHAFPTAEPKTLDTYVLARAGERFSLDAYSPSSGSRVSRLEFAADPQPICDVFANNKGARFLAVSAGRVTVWDLADQKKLVDALDPYAGKPDHAKDGLAAAFLAPEPDRIVAVSTAGAVHLLDTTTKAVVSEFVPPHGAKGAVAPGESVTRAGAGAIALAVGGVLYQIKAEPGLERTRTHDLGGAVKPLALAATGAPGRLAFVFEAEAKGKKTKDRVLLYLPVGAAKPTLLLWPAAAGVPKRAFWAQDTEAGIVTERGVVWFDEDEGAFGPVVLTQPPGGGVYTGGGTFFWYAVPHPSKPEQSVLVPLAVPFGDAAQFRGASATKPVPVVRIDANGLAK